MKVICFGDSNTWGYDPSDKFGDHFSPRWTDLLAELTGTDIPEYSFIAPDAGTVSIDWDGTSMEASVFADLLESVGDSAKVVGTYTSDYYAGSGALVCNSYGKGKAYYYGTAFTTEAAKVFLEKLDVMNPYADVLTVPECCEIAVRRKDDTRYLFVLNYEKHEVEVEFHKPVYNLDTKEIMTGKVRLKPYEVLVGCANL